jgi:hypothetical protein
MDTIMGTSPQVSEADGTLFCANTPSLSAEVTTQDNSTPATHGRAEQRCFYCRLPLYQCKNEEHWNKLLDRWENTLKSRGQDFNRGLSIDNQNIIYTNEFQAAFDKKDSDREADPEDRGGHKAPTGAGPDTEMLPETEWFFGNQAKAEVATNDRKYWEFRLEKERAFNDFVFFGAGQDWAVLKFNAFQTISAKIQSTIQEWMPELPAYMQGVVIQDWRERGWVFPSKTPANNRGQSSDQNITVQCGCGITEQRTIKSFQESKPTATVTFRCRDCSGVLSKSGSRCRKRKSQSVVNVLERKRASRNALYDPANAPQIWDFDTYVSLVLAAGGYFKQASEYRQRNSARLFCESQTFLTNEKGISDATPTTN